MIVERDAFIKHLSAYQRENMDWDQYRKKIPEALLEKWKVVMKRCRENGFINPHVVNEKIVWSQILGFKRNYKNTDKCTLCAKSQKTSDCKGTMKFKDQQRWFKPCWEN